MKCPSCGYTQQIQYDHCLACDAPMHPARSPRSEGSGGAGRSRGTSGNLDDGASHGEAYNRGGAGRSNNARSRNRGFASEDSGWQGEEVEDQPHELSDNGIRMRRGRGSSRDIGALQDDYEDDASAPAYRPARRSTRLKKPSPISPIVGIAIAVVVLIGLAALTVFVLMKAPDDQRLQQKGEHELANAQFAFAVQTLTEASVLRPKDPKLMLELARAYVGIDQVDKAWDCVKKAQTLGSGVIAEPTLASDLANYYRRRGKYLKAIELLRPLAKAGVPGKKAELADLDAAWGDDLLSDGKVEQSLKCWEEVRDMREGSRFPEAEARLSTIYQKLANNLSSSKNDDAALAYLTKLNNIAQNSRNYEMAADIYERQGKLDMAIEQLRKASNMAGKNSSINQKLGALLSRRGKELLDEGNADAGFGYLQQAKELNPENSIPKVTLRSVAISYDSGHQPRMTGEVWNPTDKSISSLGLKVELWSNAESKVLWQKDQKLVDGFTTPLGSHESRTFDVSAPVTVATDGQTELRTYLDGELYKAYPLGKKDAAETASTKKAEKLEKADKAKAAKAAAGSEKPAGQSPPTATYTPPENPAPAVSPTPRPSSRGSSEEKTMKDLEM